MYSNGYIYINMATTFRSNGLVNKIVWWTSMDAIRRSGLCEFREALRSFLMTCFFCDKTKKIFIFNQQWYSVTGNFDFEEETADLLNFFYSYIPYRRFFNLTWEFYMSFLWNIWWQFFNKILYIIRATKLPLISAISADANFKVTLRKYTKKITDDLN